MAHLRAPQASSTHRQIPSQARRPVVDVVSSLAGISLARIEDGRPFTWTATDDVASALDGCQYLAGGPCVDAAGEHRVVEYDGPRCSRADDWVTFVRVSAQARVGATLSLPVVAAADGGPLVGTVNLYARSETAFDGRQDDLARWCSTWAPARALARTAPTFGSRLRRGLTPERQRDQNAIDWAVALLADLTGTDVADAAHRLRMAAIRAGTTESSLARVLNATAA
jgi:hypothetical protein